MKRARGVGVRAMAAAAAIALAGCSSQHSATPEPSSSVPSSGPGPATSVNGLDGPLTVAVGEPLGSTQQPSGTYWVGVPVTVAGDGLSGFVPADLTLAPTAQPTAYVNGDATAASVPSTISSVVCAGTPLMPDVSGRTSGSVTGCVVFRYTFAATALTVSFYADGANDPQGVEATWPITVATR